MQRKKNSSITLVEILIWTQSICSNYNKIWQNTVEVRISTLPWFGIWDILVMVTSNKNWINLICENIMGSAFGGKHSDKTNGFVLNFAFK